MKKILVKTQYLLILLFVASCVDRPTSYDPDFHGREIISDEGEFKLTDETIILSETTLQLLSDISDDGSVYTFSGSDAVLSNLRNNQILLFGISELTPYGALRRVRSIQQSGNRLTVNTRAAALDEAFEQLTFSFNEPLRPDQVEKLIIEIPHLDHIEVLEKEQVQKIMGNNFNVEINHTFFDDFLIDGNITLSIVPDIIFDWGIIRANEIKMAVQKTIEASLEISTGTGVSYDPDPVVLFTFVLGATPPPLVITPILTVEAKAKASAEISTTVSVSKSITLEGGLHYYNRKWNEISDQDTDFSGIVPEINAEATIEGHLGPRLNFLFKGVTGPTFSMQGYGEGSIDLFRDPEIQLHAGLRGTAGWELALGTWGIARYEAPELFDVRYLIYEHSFVNIPIVNTNSVTNITPSTAISGGSITDAGGTNITQKGICWSTSQNPDINDTCTTEGSGTGSFTSYLSELSDDTRYYVRAYAENSKGIGYGQEETFVTLEADDRNYEMDICDVWQAAQSGGVGVTIDNWDISEIPEGATFDIQFQAFSIPDKFVIEYPAGTVQHDTGWRGSSSYNNDPRYPGGIEGPGSGQENDLFTKEDHDMFRVVVTGVENATAWNYQVRCRNE